MSHILKQASASQLDPKALLLRFTKNLSILQERRAKYSGNAPLELLNQIDDHEQAIALTRQVAAGELNQTEWQEALQPLLLAIQDGQVVTIEADTYVAGDVKGDVISGNKIVGDQILGNKIITHIYEAAPLPLPPAEAKIRRELSILLNKVKSFWIEGVLEKSVHNMALIDLDKETQAQAVANPWEQVLELPDQSRQTVPSDKKIDQIFDEMNRALLILGAPGSGKTITLLQLAGDLITKAEQDETFSQPVPVVFNLSTWSKGQPLIEWLVDELSAKYQIPKRIGRPWLENQRILPLLDGLDEVKDEDQAACVEAINAFGAAFGLSGLVVCSRTQEYTRLPVRLRLNGAIRLQPLTLEQVYDYLAAAGTRLDALAAALQQDEGLQELARSPLTLGVMILAYQDLPVQILTDPLLDTVEAQRRHLFDAYIERMFKYKGNRNKPYPDTSTQKWLSWLAQGMRAHHQSIFLIEQLQPSWLSDRAWFWLYMLSSRAIVGLIVGLTIAVVIGVLNQLIDPAIFGFEGDLLITALPSLLLYWTFFGLLFGFLIGLADGLRIERADRTTVTQRTSLKRRPLAINILADGLIIGTVFGLGFGLFFEPLFGLLNGLLFGSIGGLFFGFRSSRQSLTRDIQTVEALSWSWGKALKFVPFGLAAGLLLGLGLLVGGLMVGLDETVIFRMTGGSVLGLNAFWTAGLLSGLASSLLGGLMAATFGGLQSRVLETKTHPNQGVRLSARNAVLTGFGFGFAFAAAAGAILTLMVGPAAGIGFGTAAGLYIGLLAALWYGGLDIIYHYTLGLVLWAKGHIPGRYLPFLDYAAQRVFLQKVGGGYIFIHRLLLEHFAAMNKTNRE